MPRPAARPSLWWPHCWIRRAPCRGCCPGISAAGASIVTITQSRPENGAAQVEVTVRTGTMQMTVDEMLTRLSHQPCVVEIHRGA